MRVEWVGGVPANNYTVGREGNPISLIVDHWMVSSFDSALASFQNPNNPRGRLSAHFLIGTNGRVAQIVETDNTAYHAGEWDVNLRSIGIEHEAGPTLPPSDALYQSSAELHHHLARIYGFALEVGVTVDPHNKFFNTACPGTLDLDHIVALAGLEEDMALRDEFEAYKKETDATIDAMKRAYNPLYHHVHLPGEITPSASGEPLVPPVEGAKYAGSSADGAQVLWLYPDGTVHP